MGRISRKDRRRWFRDNKAIQCSYLWGSWSAREHRACGSSRRHCRRRGPRVARRLVSWRSCWPYRGPRPIWPHIRGSRRCSRVRCANPWRCVSCRRTRSAAKSSWWSYCRPPGAYSIDANLLLTNKRPYNLTFVKSAYNSIWTFFLQTSSWWSAYLSMYPLYNDYSLALAIHYLCVCPFFLLLCIGVGNPKRKDFYR